MNLKLPIIELVDRYTIALIKYEKNLHNDLEFNYYRSQMDQLDISIIKHDLDELKNIHLAIWDLEKELKSGQEDRLSLEEIGRRAIQIRNMNNLRIKIKNQMADKLGCDVKEIKKDHLSE